MAGHGSPSKPSPDVGITPLTSREPEGSMFGTGSRTQPTIRRRPSGVKGALGCWVPTLNMSPSSLGVSWQRPTASQGGLRDAFSTDGPGSRTSHSQNLKARRS